MGVLKAALLALLGPLGAAASIARSRPPPVILDGSCHIPQPALFWGSNSLAALSSKDPAQRSQPHISQDVANLVASPAEGVEAVVVLLAQHSEYSTARVASAATQGLHTHLATADAVLPYVYPAERRLSELLPEAAGASQLAVTHTDAANLLQLLKTQQGPLSNGVPDLIVASAGAPSTPEALDALVGSVRGALQEAAPDAFVLLVAGDSGATEGCGRRSLVAESISMRRAQEITTARTIQITPDILAGLLFFFFFLFLLWVGLGCLGSISYPKEFIHPEQQPALGREY